MASFAPPPKNKFTTGEVLVCEILMYNLYIYTNMDVVENLMQTRRWAKTCLRHNIARPEDVEMWKKQDRPRAAQFPQ